MGKYKLQESQIYFSNFIDICLFKTQYNLFAVRNFCWLFQNVQNPGGILEVIPVEIAYYLLHKNLRGYP